MKKIILISELMSYLSTELDEVINNGMNDKSPDYIAGYTDAIEFLLKKVRDRW